MSTVLDQKQLSFLMGSIPGSVEPGIWQIRHSAGIEASVDLENHLANIPGAVTVWDAAVQQHEQGHVRWDLPLSKLGALAPALVMPSVLPWYKMMREWVIDLRLVLAAELDASAVDPRIGMDKFDWTAMPDPQSLNQETRGQRWCQFAYVYTGSRSAALRNHTGEIWALLDDPARALLTRAFQEVTDPLNAYDDNVSAQWAVKLASHWDSTRTTTQHPQPPTTTQYEQAKQEGAIQAQQAKTAHATVSALTEPSQAPPVYADIKAANAVAQGLQGQPASVTPQVRSFAEMLQTFTAPSTPTTRPSSTRPGQKSKNGPKGPTVTQWRDNVVICDHLSLARPGKRLKAPKGASEEGVVIVDLPRVFQDGRPFKTGARPAGTIIVDTSGSMNWTTEQLEEVIRRAPGVVVGMYNSHGRPDKLKPGARICIVARDGRRADIAEWERSHQFSGGNNGSDIAALTWLADRHQKGPKFVISDGEFWGDGRYPNNEGMATQVMQAGKILRVPDLNAMIDVANHRPAMLSDGGDLHPCTKRRANNR